MKLTFQQSIFSKCPDCGGRLAVIYDKEILTIGCNVLGCAFTIIAKGDINMFSKHIKEYSVFDDSLKALDIIVSGGKK